MIGCQKVNRFCDIDECDNEIWKNVTSRTGVVVDDDVVSGLGMLRLSHTMLHA